MPKKRTSLTIDTIIGKRIRLARTIMGQSQIEFAKVMNVTYQQLQKYETGFNRISASNLILLAEHTEHQLEWFFKENQLDELFASKTDQLQLLNLTSAFLSIKSETQRKNILNLVNSIAGVKEDE
jgi:transcriptional regulator with XRE-family HTH domain